MFYARVGLGAGGEVRLPCGAVGFHEQTFRSGCDSERSHSMSSSNEISDPESLSTDDAPLSDEASSLSACSLDRAASSFEPALLTKFFRLFERNATTALDPLPTGTHWLLLSIEKSDKVETVEAVEAVETVDLVDLTDNEGRTFDVADLVDNEELSVSLPDRYDSILPRSTQMRLSNFNGFSLERCKGLV